jgi:hypothetical protein
MLINKCLMFPYLIVERRCFFSLVEKFPVRSVSHRYIFGGRVRVGDLAHCARALVVVLRNRLIMMIIIIVYGGDILCVK